MTPKNLQYSDIWFIQCSPSIGHEYKGHRPALIVQQKDLPHEKGLVSVIPMSSYKGKQWRDDILIQPDPMTNRLHVASLIKVQHIQSYDTTRFIRKIGRMDEKVMMEVKKYLSGHFGL